MKMMEEEKLDGKRKKKEHFARKTKRRERWSRKSFSEIKISSLKIARMSFDILKFKKKFARFFLRFIDKSSETLLNYIFDAKHQVISKQRPAFSLSFHPNQQRLTKVPVHSAPILPTENQEHGIVDPFPHAIFPFYSKTEEYGLLLGSALHILCSKVTVGRLSEFK
jgi:hypothetical protein